MQAENSVAPISHLQPASKSNRMPLSQWKASATVATQASAQDVSPAAADIADPQPIDIRGTLSEQTVARVAVAPAAVAVAPARPRRKLNAPRLRPVNLVAEAAVPEIAPPSFFERLFALRTL